ncbi:unnamed protein product [Oikopleura dioica]|uniref:Sulfotransferase n=1 Tax=Oikopleura dioica TaxID=34765 RepID=E4Y9F3_OIKDI|nr:unnamed protein product [Oikopleura dioica]
MFLPWEDMKGILFIIRNPFDATIAEWKRQKGGGHTSQADEEIFKRENWESMARASLKRWADLIRNVFEKHTGVNTKGQKIPLHIILYEDMVRNATLEMSRVLDFIEKENYFFVDDRSSRLRCLTKALLETEKFHRKKKPPSFEYFSEELIDEGNKYIEEGLLLLIENDFPLVDIIKYKKKHTASTSLP